MKKLTFTAMAIACALQGWCLAPGETTRIEGPGTGVYHPVLSPDGNSLLYSSIEHTGLKAYNMVSGEIKVINDAPAAGFAPIFSADGSKVFYRTADMVDGLLCHDVRSYDMTGETSDIIAPMSRRSINLNAAASMPTYAYANYQTITVCDNGEEKELSPVSDAHSYLWASISPDGSKLLFTEPFKGVFVSNLDGTDARLIAPKGDFAAWVDNNTAIFVKSTDDGYVTLTSQLFAADINSGETVALTADDVMVSEATAAAGKIVYSTFDGNLYLLTIK